MPDDLTVAMERLRTSTQRLNSLCDTAAQIVRDTEAFLEETQVGVEAKVLIVDEVSDDGCPFGSHYLGYEWYHGKFRIVTSFEPGNSEREVSAWAEDNRNWKLRTFSQLPDLLVEIATHVDERVAKAEQTIAEVSAQLPLPKKRKGADK